MQKAGIEIAKFIYAILLAFAFIIAFAFILDLFCLVFLGGMQDPAPLKWQMLFFKQFPILSGTISFYVHSSFSYILWLTIAFGGMARVIIGDGTLPFLSRFESRNAE